MCRRHCAASSLLFALFCIIRLHIPPPSRRTTLSLCFGGVESPGLGVPSGRCLYDQIGDNTQRCVSYRQSFALGGGVVPRCESRHVGQLAMSPWYDNSTISDATSGRRACRRGRRTWTLSVRRVCHGAAAKGLSEVERATAGQKGLLGIIGQSNSLDRRAGPGCTLVELRS